MKNRDLSLKPRNVGTIQPEKLREILVGVCPKEMADKLFNDLMTDKTIKEDNQR